MLQRMRELALQSSNGTTTSADRSYLVQSMPTYWLKSTASQNTQWNGNTILNHITAASSTFKYQVGANGGQTIAVNFAT